MQARNSASDLGPPTADLRSLTSLPRAYLWLTAPNRGKTRLNGPNRAKIFSGGSRASSRGCASETATPPQQPAATRTNLHLLAALAPTCAEKNFCRKIAFVVPPSGGVRVLGPSVVNHKSLTLTPWSQTKVNVANCRCSKIRPKTYTLNLNTRNAGLQTGKPIRSRSRPRRRPRSVLHASLRLFRGPSLELGTWDFFGHWCLVIGHCHVASVSHLA